VKNSLAIFALLTIPCALLAVGGIIIGRVQESERQARIAYYAQPFAPVLKLERGKVPGYSLPGLFQVDAHCISNGGGGRSQWLVRGVLLKRDKKGLYEIWDAQKPPGSLGVRPVSWGSPGNCELGHVVRSKKTQVARECVQFWRFDRDEETAELVFACEAVALPLPDSVDPQASREQLALTYATPKQIANAKRLPGARYFHESIDLRTKDDKKHHYAREAE
jgi:hypothetical protein